MPALSDHDLFIKIYFLQNSLCYQYPGFCCNLPSLRVISDCGKGNKLYLSFQLAPKTVAPMPQRVISNHLPGSKASSTLLSCMSASIPAGLGEGPRPTLARTWVLIMVIASGVLPL